MQRLEQRAEEAIANGDAEGAASSMGKAALMAAQLAKQRDTESLAEFFHGLEQLFRAQEHAYRAFALFERAGGRPPASSGVCASIRLARLRITESMQIFTASGSAVLPQPYELHRDRYRRLASDWVGTISGLRSDFECPQG